jgi:hypothetical protein
MSLSIVSEWIRYSRRNYLSAVCRWRTMTEDRVRYSIDAGDRSGMHQCRSTSRQPWLHQSHPNTKVSQHLLGGGTSPVNGISSHEDHPSLPGTQVVRAEFAFRTFMSLSAVVTTKFGRSSTSRSHQRSDHLHWGERRTTVPHPELQA